MIKYLFSLTFKNQKGTSLIEILVSLCMVLLIFHMTYIIAFSASQIVKSRNYTTASTYAVSIIEAGRSENIDNGVYQVDGDYMGITMPSGMEAQILVSNIENMPFLRIIKVTVSWDEGSHGHQLEMQSMIRRDL